RRGCGGRCTRGRRCRRRRCRRRRPNQGTRVCRRGPVPSRRSFFPAFVLLVFFLVLVLVVFAFLVLEIVVVFVFVVVVRRDIELDRRKADHLEVGPTLRATELIALVDVEFVDFDFGVAFRAGGHNRLRSLRIPPGGTDREYSDIVRGSAMWPKVCMAAF